MRAPRRRPDAPQEGLITNENELMKLVHGDRQAWERLGHPELGGRREPTGAERAAALLEIERDEDSGCVFKVPYSKETEVYWTAMLFSIRSQEHERLRYLLLNDLLGGEALSTAQWLKRRHEDREWRHRQK